jgi:hypothetical protein
MAMLKKSDEERAQKEARKRQKAIEKAAQSRQRELDKAWHGFWASPAGEARRAFYNGDHVFQYAIDVMNQSAIIVAMIGSNTSKKTADPSAVLNAVCHEGWELVNGDFVFVQSGQQSRDKFMSSGQNVAVSGTVMGYYLFRRCEANRIAETDEALRKRLAGLDDAVPDSLESKPAICPECGEAFADLDAYTTHFESTHQD